MRKCHKSTDCYPSQYMKLIGQLHAAANLQRCKLARMTCGPQCRAAFCAEEVILLLVPVLEPRMFSPVPLSPFPLGGTCLTAPLFSSLTSIQHPI